MNGIKRIMVGLDLTTHDVKLVHYTAMLSSVLDAGKIYFINIQRNLEYPGGKLFKTTGVGEPADEAIEKYMKEKCVKYFKNNPTELMFKVVDGDTLKEMHHWAKIKNIDLVIIGHKRAEMEGGLAGYRLANKLQCPLMFIPESPSKYIRKILVPLDLSDFSLLALKQAFSLCRKYKNAIVICLHITDMPLSGFGNRSIGITPDIVADEYLKSDRESYNKMIERINTQNQPVKQIYILNEKNNIAAHILDEAREHKVDLIIMGSRGKSTAELMLLGSVTDKLIRMDLDCPLLIMREKKYL